MARGDQRRALSEAGPGGSCARRAAVELRLWPESTLLDLGGWRARGAARLPVAARRDEGGRPVRHHAACRRAAALGAIAWGRLEIGRASGRERVCQYVYISGGA